MRGSSYLPSSCSDRMPAGARLGARAGAGVTEARALRPAAALARSRSPSRTWRRARGSRRCWPPAGRRSASPSRSGRRRHGRAGSRQPPAGRLALHDQVDAPAAASLPGSGSGSMPYISASASVDRPCSYMTLPNVAVGGLLGKQVLLAARQHAGPTAPPSITSPYLPRPGTWPRPMNASSDRALTALFVLHEPARLRLLELLGFEEIQRSSVAVVTRSRTLISERGAAVVVGWAGGAAGCRARTCKAKTNQVAARMAIARIASGVSLFGVHCACRFPQPFFSPLPCRVGVPALAGLRQDRLKPVLQPHGRLRTVPATVVCPRQASRGKSATPASASCPTGLASRCSSR